MFIRFIIIFIWKMERAVTLCFITILMLLALFCLMCAVLWGVVEGSFLGLSANNFFFYRVSTVLFLTCLFVNRVTFKQWLVGKQTAFPEWR